MPGADRYLSGIHIAQGLMKPFEWMTDRPEYDQTKLLSRLADSFSFLVDSSQTDSARWQMCNLAGNFFSELHRLLEALPLPNQFCEPLRDCFDGYSRVFLYQLAGLEAGLDSDPDLFRFRLLLYPEVLARALEIHCHSYVPAEDHPGLHEFVMQQLRQDPHPLVKHFFRSLERSLVTNIKAPFDVGKTDGIVRTEIARIERRPTSTLQHKIQKTVHLIPLQIMLQVLINPTDGLPQNEKKRVATL